MRLKCLQEKRNVSSLASQGPGPVQLPGMPPAQEGALLEQKCKDLCLLFNSRFPNLPSTRSCLQDPCWAHLHHPPLLPRNGCPQIKHTPCFRDANLQSLALDPKPLWSEGLVGGEIQDHLCSWSGQIFFLSPPNRVAPSSPACPTTATTAGYEVAGPCFQHWAPKGGYDRGQIIVDILCSYALALKYPLLSLSETGY